MSPEEKLLRSVMDQNNWCTFCNSPRFDSEKFCSECGVPNHHFSSSSFLREYGEIGDTVESLITRRCEKNHIFDQDYPHIVFCCFCGCKLFLNH